MNNNMVVSLVKYSLCAIISTLTTPVLSLGWLLSSFFSSDVNRSAHIIWREKSGHVRNLNRGPEPNLDMYAVWATIQLMLGQE